MWSLFWQIIINFLLSSQRQCAVEVLWGGPAEYHKKNYIISGKIFVAGFCSWFVILTISFISLQLPASPMFGPDAKQPIWLLQSCKVLLLDFLHMTTYIWTQWQVDCSMYLGRTACQCNIYPWQRVASAHLLGDCTGSGLAGPLPQGWLSGLGGPSILGLDD